MKRLIIPMAIVLLTLGFNQSCSKDETDVDENITEADMPQIKAAVESGDWRITNYSDDDMDETTNYMGYSFTFNSDGILGATNGNISVSGAWSITISDNSTDDSSDDDIDFNIFFTSPDIFEELTDDWEIVNYSTTKIELIDISGGDGNTDYLTFEKN
ncbi:MAG: hypothetical protein KJO52_05580 [Maribacter sp.]|nr:hypothetical protein [Maribacter sp.]MBT8301860.1 hypothetical protein [Maribacter sp.]NND78806.1 hypothetical protein [Maribacter sp.]NNK19458.1 hypothetical protein [Maribacter sp.]